MPSARIALFTLSMWVEEAFPRSLNMGRRIFSTNQTVAREVSGILKLPCTCTRREVWWRWILRVPIEHGGIVAVFKVILRSLFKSRPLVSSVSILLVSTQATDWEIVVELGSLVPSRILCLH